MDYKNLTDAQIAGLLDLAKEEGVELPDEFLTGVAGGSAWGGNSGSCPVCGSDDFHITEDGREAYCVCGHRGPASQFFNRR